MNTRAIPQFQTEAEEARWWFDHDEELTDDFEQAATEGMFGETFTKVLLPYKDAEVARVQAKARGLGFEDYVSQLLHEALQRAERQS